jgi:maltose/moltooligosaccharide transporter
MPNSPALWIAASMLWMMDASINVTMEPFRAFVGDSLPDEQRTTGFAMQSFFIGVGAVFASALPWMLSNWAGVSNEAANGAIPDSVRIAFYVGGACLLAAVWWTVFTTKEYTPAELDAMERARTERIEASAPPAKGFIAGGVVWLVAGAAAIAASAAFGLRRELYVLAGLITGYGAAQIATGWIRQGGATPGGLLEIIVDLKTMPATMKQLAVVQFFSWFGLFAMWIYTTAAVTARHFGTTNPTAREFNQGADWVGVLFATYNGVAAIAALLIPWLAGAIGRRAAHAAALVLGAGGFAAFFVIDDPRFLVLPMIGVGFAWASILSTPYAILAGALPTRKMGVYMGVFNLFIVIPQLLAATVLGWLVTTFFAGQAIYALALGACSFVLAAAAVFAVREPQNSALAASSSGS